MKASVNIRIGMLIFLLGLGGLGKELNAQRAPVGPLKIGNLQSANVLDRGKFLFSIMHRFGDITSGAYNLFGLENGNPNFQFAYGLSHKLQLGIGRGSLRKTYTGSVKYQLVEAGEERAFDLALFSTVNLNSQLKKAEYPNMRWADRLSYCTQLIFSKEFGRRFTFQVAPAFVRQNLVWEQTQRHEQFALGLGLQYALSPSMTLMLDHSMHFNRTENSKFKDPLTLTWAIHTAGHDFQLLFTNARAMTEVGYVSNAEGDWWAGNIFFGFNIVRTFGKGY